MDKVSVVTINYNMREGLAVTMASVLAQDYPNLEYVVVDGGSADGSLDVIKAESARLGYWVSEPDSGRYDAMNKGARAATGDWVIFMNAGDVFSDAAVLSDVFALDRAGADLIYGHAMRVYPREGARRLFRAGSIEALPMRMEFSHQSLLARRALLMRYPFSLDLAIIADAEFVIRAKLGHARFQKVDRLIAIFEMGGISDNQRGRSMAEHWRVLSRLGLLTVPRRLAFAIMAVRALTVAGLRRGLPVALRRHLLNRVLR